MIAGRNASNSGQSKSASGQIFVFSRSFLATPELVRGLLVEMTERIGPHVSGDLIGRAELVLAELLNNVVQHGSAGCPGQAPLVHLSVVAQNDGLACSVSDDGGLLPHVCLSSKAPEPSSFPEGGFGWFLIGHLTQSLAYFRENDRNFVAFTVPMNAVDPG
ncbi:ATP-binding protein [Paracoccus aerodenitrificans]|uniref:ATP-binding protein n=1 Tax=Paracoccus aerodenitrificans TaxID=3017781 RepID=UPI0022F01204|nr:ATP-binding protein [Paracoccus aerodenitrificans]WBU63009.1 ATP-binding protein [Paracoccus aerodenitrificans]